MKNQIFKYDVLSVFSRRFRLTITLMLSVLLIVTLSVQAKPSNENGGGKPGDDPEPCTDKFPSFVYVQRATRKSPAKTFLASEFGCRREELPGISSIGRVNMNMTTDRSKGILMWAEDPDNTNQYTLRTADFTVNEAGELAVTTPKTIELIPQPTPIPSEDELYYFRMDIWGNATHTELYLVIHRIHADNSAQTHSEELWLVNLNNLEDRREIYQSVNGGWDCPDVEFPEALAACYKRGAVQWNPSGNRLYIHDNVINSGTGERWDGGIRVNITRDESLPVSEWTISSPKLVYTSSRVGATTSEVSGTAARPSEVDRYLQPETEYIATNYFDHSGNNTVLEHAILNADFCVDLYSAFDGSDPIVPELWRTCLSTDGFDTSNQLGRGDTWQSPDVLLYSDLGKRTYGIFRLDVTTGASTMLIENGRFADTGQ